MAFRRRRGRFSRRFGRRRYGRGGFRGRRRGGFRRGRAGRRVRPLRIGYRF